MNKNNTDTGMVTVSISSRIVVCVLHCCYVVVVRRCQALRLLVMWCCVGGFVVAFFLCVA